MCIFWPVSPTLGWADPVKITASGKVLIFNSNQAKLSFVAHGLERQGMKALKIDQNIERWIEKQHAYHLTRI